MVWKFYFLCSCSLIYSHAYITNFLVTNHPVLFFWTLQQMTRPLEIARCITYSSAPSEPPSIFGLHSCPEINHLDTEFECFPPLEVFSPQSYWLCASPADTYGLAILKFILGFCGIFWLLDCKIWCSWIFFFLLLLYYLYFVVLRRCLVNVNTTLMI